MQELNIERISRNLGTGFSTTVRSGLHIVRDTEGTVWFKHKRNEKVSIPVTGFIKCNF